MSPSDGGARFRAAADLLLWTVILAGTAGLIEGVALGVADAAGFIAWVSVDHVWQAPVANVLLIGAVAVPLAVAAWGMPPAWRWFLMVPAALATLGLVFLVVHYKLAVWAQVILSFGIGYQVARFIERRRYQWRGKAVGSAALLAFAVAASGIGVRMDRVRAGGAASVRTEEARPSFLLVVLDAVRASSLGAYGYERPTSPVLDRLAARGVVFEQAFSTAPWTLPSHGSMFSGRWPHELRTGWRRGLPDSIPLLAEFMRSNSYRTGGFTGNLLYTTEASGFNRGFDRYESFPNSLKQFLLAPALAQLAWQRHLRFRSERRLSDRKSASAVTRGFLDWVGTEKRPFFAFLNLYDAHAPYEPPPAWRDRFRSADTRIDLYDASIAAQDSVLGATLDSLDARGLLDRTVVLVTADHGELHGEHGIHGHGNSLYVAELRVPLVIAGPGIPMGRRVPATVSLRDVAATVVQLTNLSGAPFPGETISHYWSDSTHGTVTSPAYSEVEPAPGVAPDSPLAGGPLRSLVSFPYRAVQHVDGRIELYDLAKDPGEERDVSSDVTLADTLARMRRQLDAVRRWP